MKIHGLQKMTLLDFPGLVACTVFLGGCDLRCPFCHNAELLDMNVLGIMDEKELYAFLETRRGKLDGVAVTGGEPTLRKDLPELLRTIKDMGFKVKLDTTGNHPDMLKTVVGEGLVDYVAMDVKNSKERYAETVGLTGFDISRVDESISFLLRGDVEYEFRTTVVKQFHDRDSFIGIAEWIKGAEKYYLQNFVDRDTVPFAGLEARSENELKEYAEIVKPYVGVVELRGV
ncbi:MAG: anaerobic ribonucleoside-triphosphate reductase activating protein [Eubacterium sp.]|nr:anaerobic ribonucleoside-triphosphate reductase activating protein [Eubacterium sp.]